jgi:hypothetical protein
VAPVSELLNATVGSDGQDLRVALDEPRRRSCSRRADDHVESLRGEDSDHLVQPIELVHPGPRLEP